VCNSHGGKAPQVVRKARERIFEAIDPVLTSLIAMALDDGLAPRDRIAASRLVLDAAGLLGGRGVTDGEAEGQVIAIAFPDRQW
jgi:hypothetical protein